MSIFLSERFRGKEGYKMGERPQGTQFIKLNANESPYPPSPMAEEALRCFSAASLKQYEDPYNISFRESVAGHFGICKEQVFADGGTDVILGYCLLAYGSSRPGFVFPDITYSFYKTFSEVYGTYYKEIPLKGDFTIDPSDYYHCGHAILIANPNAPTGMILPRDSIEKIIASNPDSIVIIDEAYVDFGNETCVPLIKKYGNLIVIQTLSKSRCLAGARIGFAVSSSDIVSELSELRAAFNPDSVTAVSQAMGIAAMNDDAYMKQCTTKIVATRNRSASAFAARGFAVTDSHANFLFVNPIKISAEEYYKRLKERNILVRYYDSPRIRDYVRITVGTDEQMDELFRQTDAILVQDQL